MAQNEENTDMTVEAKEKTVRGGKYLTFILAEEE
jgi:hypothetical protein